MYSHSVLFFLLSILFSISEMVYLTQHILCPKWKNWKSCATLPICLVEHSLRNLYFRFWGMRTVQQQISGTWAICGDIGCQLKHCIHSKKVKLVHFILHTHTITQPHKLYTYTYPNISLHCDGQCGRYMCAPKSCMTVWEHVWCSCFYCHMYVFYSHYSHLESIFSFIQQPEKLCCLWSLKD